MKCLSNRLKGSFSIKIPSHRILPYSIMEGAQEAGQWQIFLSVIAIAISFLVLIILENIWFKPQRIRSVLDKQGIKGPKPSFPQGNLSEIQRVQSQYINLSSTLSFSISDQWFCFLFPYLQIWRKQYGIHIRHAYVYYLDIYILIIICVYISLNEYCDD